MAKVKYSSTLESIIINVEINNNTLIVLLYLEIFDTVKQKKQIINIIPIIPPEANNSRICECGCHIEESYGTKA